MSLQSHCNDRVIIKALQTMAEPDFVSTYRGQTPDDLRDKCYQLCKDYLGGVWLDVEREIIDIKRITGGFSNQLFYCGLPRDIQTAKREPKEVAIRLYCDKHFNKSVDDGDQRLSDVVVGLVLSEKKLGPKIYGVFPNGQIMQYYKHHEFRKRECDNPVMVEKLARNLAKVHALDVPINKNVNWIFINMDDFYEKAYALFPIDQYIDECNLEAFKKYDLKSEIEWIKRCVEFIGSPIVFSHNDFRGSNVMVIERETENGRTDTDGEILFCDFEYSSYSYRGIDFGWNFCEWGFESLNDVKHETYNYPEDSVLDLFLSAYIEESVMIYGTEYAGDERNSLKQLRSETKVFSMVNRLFFTLFTLQLNEPIFTAEFDKRSQIAMSEKLYAKYIAMKRQFIGGKVINEYN